MPNLVLLNFEDTIGNYSGALQATVTGTTNKANVKGNQLQIFDCVELMRRYVHGLNNPLTANDFQPLSAACFASDKIYVVIHGDPRRGVGLTTNMQQLCTAAQLAMFMLRIMPGRGQQYVISLIMCYGARSQVWQHSRVDHQGEIKAKHLQTSFAYKLFRDICPLRNLRLTARTGRVNHNNQGVLSVEEDMTIDAYIAEDEHTKDKAANNQARLAAVNVIKTAYLQNGGTQLQWNAWWTKHFQNAHAFAWSAEERAIKSYLGWLTHKSNKLAQKHIDSIQDAGGLQERSKYGKLVYTYGGGQLQVVNKYGNPHDHSVPAGHVIYNGPLL